ncbi:MAG: phytanoyl-CoA dioxygenase family protein [Lysobacterales bacterium]
MDKLSTQQRHQFSEHGFLRLPGLANSATLDGIHQQVSGEMRQSPLELEIEVGYPGAPKTLQARGANTPRRLLNAFARGGALSAWAQRPTPIIGQLLDTSGVWLSQAHHNCVMTKYPSYSSDTLWHQDVRFWSFEPPLLINCWLALGAEREQNGGLRVIAGSHRWSLDPERLDQGKFLDPNHPVNAAAIANSLQLDLDPGDALFFDAGLFHSATRNRTDAVKLSVVYTYHGSDVRPIEGTRSAAVQPVHFDI